MEESRLRSHLSEDGLDCVADAKGEITRLQGCNVGPLLTTGRGTRKRL
jgi:hypothetical protein